MFDASKSNTKIDLTFAQFNVLVSAYLTAMVEDEDIDMDTGYMLKAIINTIMKDLATNREDCMSVIEQLMNIEKQMIGTDEDIEDEAWDIVSAANKIAKKTIEEMN